MEEKFVLIKDTLINSKNIVLINKDCVFNNDTKKYSYSIDVELNNNTKFIICYGVDKELRDIDFNYAYSKLG